MSFFPCRDFTPALSALLPIDRQKPRSVFFDFGQSKEKKSIEKDHL